MQVALKAKIGNLEQKKWKMQEKREKLYQPQKHQ